MWAGDQSDIQKTDVGEIKMNISKSKGAEIFLTHLSLTAANLGKEINITPHDVFLAEQLAYSYSYNILKGAVDRFFNPKSKSDPTKVEFYVKPIRSQNKGRIKDDDWIGNEQYGLWYAMATFTPNPLSQTDIEYIKNTTISQKYIDYGIKSARDMKNLSIPYAVSIGANQQANDQEIADQRSRKIEANKYHDSHSEEHRHTILDMIGLIGTWEEEMENMDLQKKRDKQYRKR